MTKTNDIKFKKTNLEINYEDFINPKNTETIVILHWWWWSSQSWLTVWKLLLKNWFNVIIPDLPGFGKTKLEKVFDLDEYATVIEEFIKELWLKNIILWWHSNWWAISIKIANRWNINILRLVLNNSAWIRNDTKRNFKRKILKLLIRPIKYFKKVPLYNRIRNIFYKAIWSHDYLNAEKNPYLKETYLNMIKSDLKDTIKKIELNTLLIWWENDTYTPKSDWNYMRNHIKNSKIVILENEKHWIHLTSPEKLVNTFLNNI